MMRRQILLILIALFSFVAGAGAMQAEPTAEEMLNEYKSIAMPTIDPNRRGDRAYSQQIQDQIAAVRRKRADFAIEFQRRFPEHPLVYALLSERWSVLGESGQIALALDEMEKSLEGKNPPLGTVRVRILFARAVLSLNLSEFGWDLTRSAIEDAIKANPDDPSVASLLLRAAGGVRDTGERLAIYKRIVDEYPKSPAAGDAQLELTHARALNQRIAVARPTTLPAEERDLLRRIRSMGPRPEESPRQRQDDPNARETLATRQRTFDLVRGELFKDFYDRYPAHPEAAEMLQLRWRALIQYGQSEMAFNEAAEILARPGNDARSRQLQIRFSIASAQAQQGAELDKARSLVQEFITAAPIDPRGAELLYYLARRQADSAQMDDEYRRILQQYPTAEAAQWIRDESARPARTFGR